MNTRRSMLPVLAAVACVAGGLAGACAPLNRAETRPAPSPAPISHMVLVKLIDEADAPRVIADSRRALADIPGVVSFVAGTPLDTGRPEVDGDYSVGLYIGFESTQAYDVYAQHPDHLALVAKWKPRLQWLRIHDVLDESP